MDSISDKVKKIRVEYEDKPLNIEDLDTNPLEQFNVWFQIAIDAEVNEANAMAISTISEAVSYTHLTLPTKVSV